MNMNINPLFDLRKKIDDLDPRYPDLTSITSRLIEVQNNTRLNHSIDEMLLLLSEKFKGLGSGGQEEITWNPPDSFHRSTTKYWVKASDSIKIKCMLLPHLPILVPQSTPSRPSSCSSSSSLISSVYLDNANLDLYHARLFREDGSSLVRIRWYGEVPALDKWPSSPLPHRSTTDPIDDKLTTVFVEKKTHREAWTGELSSKERSPLMISSLSSFLAGHGSFESQHHHASTTSVSSLDCPYPQSPICLAPPPSPSTSALHGHPADDGKDGVKRRRAAFLREVQHMAASLQLAPILKTRYTRTAFQRSDTNAVRISLDENVSMIAYPSQETVSFEHCILEIKLEDGDQEPPEWLQKIKKCGLLVECPKFSKYAHSVSLLFPTKIKRSPSYFVSDSMTIIVPSKTPSLLSGLFLPSTANAQGVVYESSRAGGQKWRPATIEELKAADAVNDESHRGLIEGALLPPDIGNEAQKFKRDAHYIEDGGSSSQEEEGAADGKKIRPLMAAGGGGGGEGGGGGGRKEEEAYRAIEISPSDDSAQADQGCGSFLCYQKWNTTHKPFVYHPPHHDIEQPRSCPAAALVRSRVEPKTFFANERTFLSWMQMAILLMFAALSLMNSSSSITGGAKAEDPQARSSRVAGLALAPISILMFVYALFIYRSRTAAIMRREVARFDDQRGPVFLALLLIVVCGSIYVLHITQN